MNMTYKYVCGGIGDFLVSLQSAIKEGTIDVYSHYPNAKDFFEPFGVTINRLDHFASVEAMRGIYIGGEPLPNHRYPVFKLPPIQTVAPFKLVIGVHIEGSDYSNNFWGALGAPTKNMSLGFMNQLIELVLKEFDVMIYVFCSPKRSQEIAHEIGENKAIKIVAYPYIWESLMHVTHCDFVIGMDSCIKTMSSILRIPTITLVGDYVDHLRDAKFITPYEQDGVMKCLRFKDINHVCPTNIIKMLEDFGIRNLLP